MKNSQDNQQKNSIKQGDIIKLGRHYLVCGDATNPELMKKVLGANKIKLILTDPPYGVDYVNSKADFDQFNRSHLSIKNDHIQDDESYIKFTNRWLAAIKLSLADKNSLYIFNSDKMIFSLKQALDQSGFKFSQLLIWLKNQSVVGRLDYQPQHELIAYGWYGKHAFLKSKDKSVLTYPKPQKSRLHPTMKPLGLLRRIILNSSKINDFVYDPFGGSGSTLIACEQTHRSCIMIELDPNYCQVIINRFKSSNKDLHA